MTESALQNSKKTYIVMAYIVMAYRVVAYIGMTYIVMAPPKQTGSKCSVSNPNGKPWPISTRVASQNTSLA